MLCGVEKFSWWGKKLTAQTVSHFPSKQPSTCLRFVQRSHDMEVVGIMIAKHPLFFPFPSHSSFQQLRVCCWVIIWLISFVSIIVAPSDVFCLDRHGEAESWSVQCWACDGSAQGKKVAQLQNPIDREGFNCIYRQLDSNCSGSSDQALCHLMNSKRYWSLKGWIDRWSW